LQHIPIIKEENAALNSKFRGGSNKVTNMLRRVDKPISAKLIILLCNVVNLKQTVISTLDNYILMIMPFFFRYFLTLSTVDFS
jgi:hypothetical protein